MPRRAPEFLAGIARRGDAWMHRVDRGLGMALLATPVKSEERRTQAASGSPFLWILSFGEAKESISPVGARIDIKSNIALAIPIKTPSFTKVIHPA